MSRIPRSWVEPYYVQVEGQERQDWEGACLACKCKFFGEFAREQHMKSPRHMAMLRRWVQACSFAAVEAPPVINFAV